MLLLSHILYVCGFDPSYYGIEGVNMRSRWQTAVLISNDADAGGHDLRKPFYGYPSGFAETVIVELRLKVP